MHRLYAMMHQWIVLYFLGVLAFTRAQTCPDLDVNIIKLDLKPTVGSGSVGGGGYVDATVSLTNTGTTPLEGLTVRVQLPDYLIPTKMATWPRLKSPSSRPIRRDLRSLYWTDVTVLPNRAQKLLVKAYVPTCQNAASGSADLAIHASVYVLSDEDGETVTCLTEAEPAFFQVSPSREEGRMSSSSELCTPLPPPEAIPKTAGYRFYASEQRCKDSVLTPLRRRRLVATGGGDKAGNGYRALSSTTNPTLDECKQEAKSPKQEES